MKRHSGSLQTECAACKGLGYTVFTGAQMELMFNADMGGYVEVRTIHQGSGCERCLGTGQLP